MEDQQVALEMLLEALPKGWKVFVKENPRQFDHTLNTISGSLFRDKNDINKFTQDKRVILLPQNIKSEDLITNAQITVTLTGTAGWESLNLGKPCITFGSPWYSPCRSCFIVETVNDIKKALSISKKKNEVKTDVLK